MYNLNVKYNSVCNQIALTNNSTSGEVAYFTIKKLSNDGSSMQLCDGTEFTYTNSANLALVFPLQDFNAITLASQTIQPGGTFTLSFLTDNLYLIPNYTNGTTTTPYLTYLRADCNIKACNDKIVNEMFCDPKKCSDQKFLADRTRWLKFFELRENLYFIWGKLQQVQTVTSAITVSSDDSRTNSELLKMLLNMCDCCNNNWDSEKGYYHEENCNEHQHHHHNHNNPCGC